MFRVVIVEDEKPTLDLMERLVKQHPLLEVAGVFTNPLEALASFESLQPDIAFLDVEMPRMGGIELAGLLKEIDEDLQIVFTTAYSSYAVDAFRVSATDYLLKPVVPTDLDRVVSRIAKSRRSHTSVRPPSAEQNQPFVRCLGTFETRGKDGNPVSWPTRKTEELFAYFLTYPNRLADKWQLADLLWPDMEERRSLHNLHNTIYRLKKTLTETGIPAQLTHVNEGYMLNIEMSLTDIEQLRAFLAHRSSLDDEHLAEANRLFRACHGYLFGNKDYSWSSHAAADAVSQYAKLVRMIVNYYMQRGDRAGVKETLHQYVGYAPLDEEMHEELLRLYAEDGDSAAYLRHYAEYEKLLREDLGLTPPQELQLLAQEMRESV